MNEILAAQNKDQQKIIQLLEESLIMKRLEAEKNLAREQVAAAAEPKRRTFVHGCSIYDQYQGFGSTLTRLSEK